MPSGVMFLKEVWIIATIGQITTTAISAIAGPSQASGAGGPRRRTSPTGGGGGNRARPARCGPVTMCGHEASSRPSAGYRDGPGSRRGPGPICGPVISSRSTWPSAGSRQAPSTGCR